MSHIIWVLKANKRRDENVPDYNIDLRLCNQIWWKCLLVSYVLWLCNRLLGILRCSDKRLRQCSKSIQPGNQVPQEILNGLGVIVLMFGEFWTLSSVHFNIEIDWFTNADCEIVKFSIKIFIFKEVQIELEWSNTFVESPFVHFWFENIIRFDDGFKSIVTAEIPFDWSRECQTSKWTRCVMSCWWNRKCICVCDKVFAFSSS